MAAVAPGQERIPSPGPPQQELTEADSSAVLDRARDAQRRFERLRVRHLPLSLDSGSSPCDELIGRMCYWHGDNHSEPDPEAVEITVAREELLDTLAHAARQLPVDGWIAGQRVHYLVEAGRAHDALAVARACTAPEPGWCEALRGLALHRLERFEDAERAYRIALKAMDPREAEEWLSLALLLERTDESRLDELAADARGGQPPALGTRRSLLPRARQRPLDRTHEPARRRSHSAARAQSPRASLDIRPGRTRHSLRTRDQLGPIRSHKRIEHAPAGDRAPSSPLGAIHAAGRGVERQVQPSGGNGLG